MLFVLARQLWMIYPNIMPASVLAESAAVGGADATNPPRPPRVEYLATLSRHSAAVNVVRFSPNGECGCKFTRRSGFGWHEGPGVERPPLPPPFPLPQTAIARYECV
jgi:hypothetical protein